MYKINKHTETTIKVNTSYKGETIEDKIRRITTQNQPITDGAPLIYTERKQGVRPEYDIRTDRWEVAIEAMDKVSKTTRAKRDELPKPEEQKKLENGKNNGEPESTQGTENN